tara:strand:- start:126 stop:341 length:216 start_codon:yes stop_codon:yes gene_type:complete
MFELASTISKNNMIAIILLLFGKFFGIISAGAIFAFREWAPLFLILYAVGVFGSISVALYEMYRKKEEDVN